MARVKVVKVGWVGDTIPAIAPIGSAPTAADFPMTGNTIGDIRTADDTGHAHRWSGTAWIDIGQWRGDPGPDTELRARVDPGVPAAVSQSLRGSPTGPYWAPSAAVMPQDFGAVSSTSSSAADANSDALDNAIAQAKAEGTSTLGIPVLFRGGHYVISRPMVLPRTGTTPTNVVHLHGESMRTTTIQASPAFPAGRAMIEWERASLRTNHQRIEGLRFILPDVAGVMAIRYQLNAADKAVATFEQIRDERCHEWVLRMLEFEGKNQYHEVYIDIEGSLFHGVFEDLYDNSARDLALDDTSAVDAWYDTVLLRSQHLLAGATPTLASDTPGIAYSRLDRLYGTLTRGGWTSTFAGRLVECEVGKTLCNGGRTNPNVHLRNSYSVRWGQHFGEGRGEKAIVRIEGSRYIDIGTLNTGSKEAVYPTWQAATAYIVGQRVVPTNLTSARVMTCTVAGTSGASQPTWPTTEGGTVTDGTVTWEAGEAITGTGLEVIDSTDVTLATRTYTQLKPVLTDQGNRSVTVDALSRRVRVDNCAVRTPASAPADVAGQFDLAAGAEQRDVTITGHITGSGDRYLLGARTTPPHVDTVPPLAVNQTSLSSPTADRAYAVTVTVQEPTRITRAITYVGTPAGTGEVGIYTHDGSAWNRVRTSGAVTITATNALQAFPFASPIWLQPGIAYRMVAVCSDGAVTLPRAASYPGVADITDVAAEYAAHRPLPSSLGTPSGLGSTRWWVRLDGGTISP